MKKAGKRVSEKDRVREKDRGQETRKVVVAVATRASALLEPRLSSSYTV